MNENDITVMPVPLAPPAELHMEMTAPSAPPPPSLPPAPTKLTPDQLKILRKQGYTEGTAQTLMNSLSKFSLRIWVIDNSGSMATADGHRLKLGSNGSIQELNGTRWKELQETMEYHIQLASLLGAPSEFRMLNPSSNGGVNQFSIAMKEGLTPFEKEQEVTSACQTIHGSEPCGVTPLTMHIHEIRSQVDALAPILRDSGQRVSVIIATDGLPSNDYGRSTKVEKDKFRDALRTLDGLPVWIVIRLCTDNKDVVEYYNNLDKELEFSLEVLDNYTDEAEEIYKVNPWLNYTLSLHRMREIGIHFRLFDFLDERQLTLPEIQDLCFFLFGSEKMDGFPDPEIDRKGFMIRIKDLIQGEVKQWHPVKKQVKSIISYKTLKNLRI